MPSHTVSTSYHRKFSGFTGHGIRWGAHEARERGPVVAGLAHPAQRNAIGTHSGAQAVYRALAAATGTLPADPPLAPPRSALAAEIGPRAQWFDPERIVSFDPWGHQVASAFAEQIAAGLEIRPTVAVTRSHIHMVELGEAIASGRLAPDGDILLPSGDVRVTKVAIDPVWWLPGVAQRFGIKESELRRALFEQTAGMYPELVTRPDLKVFLPPIGGTALYLFGNLSRLGREDTKIACRLHDECNGSDVFGSDICTCRPYLVHGIELCIEMAQQGGVGLVVYHRKEGRAHGETGRFLSTDARSLPAGSERAGTTPERPECVAGAQDMRFQELMPDPLHWLGIRRIERLASMSRVKHDALQAQGIEVVERVCAPATLVPLATKQAVMPRKTSTALAHRTREAAGPASLPEGRASGS